jgi:hypothetical protein
MDASHEPISPDERRQADALPDPFAPFTPLPHVVFSLGELLQRSLDQALDDDLDRTRERRRRQAAVDFARASVALEGFEPHKDDEELSRRYIAGEVTIADAIKAVDESADGRFCQWEGGLK